MFVILIYDSVIKQACCYIKQPMHIVTLKLAGGGGFCQLSTDIACIPSIFIKTSQILFGESCLMSAFTKKFFGKLRMIEIGPQFFFQIFSLQPRSFSQSLEQLFSHSRSEQFW
jgi:hypothetical protein